MVHREEGWIKLRKT